MQSPIATSKIAAVQAAPVYLDRDATIAKACDLIAVAGGGGARLIVFPEAFIPAYPGWVWHLAPAQAGGMLSALYAELLDQAVTIPSVATDRLCEAARRAGAYVAIGMSERNAEASGGSLYNTLLYIDADGQILGKHRKMVPTGPERLIWAQGDGSTLSVYDTPFGKISGLICFENYMPLARYALYAWGTQIYIAATVARGEDWLATLRHMAIEGRVFVIGCGIVERKSDIPDRYTFKQTYEPDIDEWINLGDSAIVNPNGEFIAGPLRGQEGILYAEIDPVQMHAAKWELDVAGHYARPDVFQLTVRTGVQPMITGVQTMITAQEVGPPQNTQSSEVAAPDKPAIGRTER
jgi:nitrilase